MEKDWLFSTDEYICELRTVAVLVKENKIDNVELINEDALKIDFPHFPN